MKSALLIGILMMVGATFAAPTYRNPIIPSDFSDPDPCVGADGRVYMTASSFGAHPGLPILVSDDLVNWTQITAAVASPTGTHDEAPFSPQHGKGVWAPALRYRADKKEYVIYWGDPDRGIYRISAANPAGPWSEPRLVIAGQGLIDPCPIYDDDGRIYLANAFAASRSRMNSIIVVRELNSEEMAPLSEPVIVFDGIPSGDSTCEGPKFYKKDGEYWLFFPAGGVEKGWQMALRARSPYGPYTARRVLEQGKTAINGPHQGGWIRRTIQDAHGKSQTEDWFIHFRDQASFGRVVYLEPMTWDAQGWPVIGKQGEPVDAFRAPLNGSDPRTPFVQKPFGGLDVSDEFNTSVLDSQWTFLGKHPIFSSAATSLGFYRLYATEVPRFATSWEFPNRLVRRLPDMNFTATTKVTITAKDVDQESGILLHGFTSYFFGLRSHKEENKEGLSFRLVWTRDSFGELSDQVKKELFSDDSGISFEAKCQPAGLRAAYSCEIYLRVKVEAVPTEDIAQPKAIGQFSWSTDGKNFTAYGEKFTIRPGKWIGSTLGFYSFAFSQEGFYNARFPVLQTPDRGWIDIDWFRVTP